MRRTRTRICDRYEDQADVMDLDLRNGLFGEWVMSLLDPEKQGSRLPYEATSEGRMGFRGLNRICEKCWRICTPG